MIRLLHLAGLLLAAAWLAAAHPGGLAPALLIAGAAIAGELLPRGLARELGAPLLILLAAVLAYLLGNDGRGWLHATLGMLLTGLLLVPARPDALRMLAPLCGLELVACGLPGTGPGMWTAALVLAPLAVAALAGDAWAGARAGARAAPVPRLGWLRWAALPALAAIAVGLAALPAAALAAPRQPGREIRPRTPPPVRTPQTAQDSLEVGADGSPAPRDPSPAARLLLPERPPGLVYLRATASGLLQRELGGGAWLWMPLQGDADAPEPPPPAGARLADLVRMAGFGDCVMLPDDGDWCGLDGLSRDGDGNRWRIGLGEAVRAYRVAVDGPGRREPDPDAALVWRTLPPGLDGLPWDRIEQSSWRNQPPTLAAAHIAAALQARCAYARDDLPQSSDALATFLFAEDARQRRGHCQYFATACTILLRRAGHAARCVAGFASSQWDGSGIVFRRLHAHAWCEVLAEGRWLRVDPTPAVAHPLADREQDPASAPPPPRPEDAVPLPARGEGGRGRGWWLLAIIPAGLLALLLVRRRRRRDGRPPILRQRSDELVALARELGVRVAAHDTAGAICTRLTGRTGIDLSAELAAYEAARFGSGPPPPPWPAERLRAARDQPKAAAAG